MLIFIFTISLIISLVMIVTAPYQNVLLYKRHSGPQQLHSGYVPRLGGIACFAGLLAGYMLSDFEIQAVFFGLLIAGSCGADGVDFYHGHRHQHHPCKCRPV